MVSNDESKPFKSIYFMSDACTCKILKVPNSFRTRSSGQKNEYIKQLIKGSLFLPLDLVLNEFKTSKIFHVHASLMK